MYMEKKIANDDEEYFAKPHNPRELVLGDHLQPFFLIYLKEMKNECIEILLHPECSKFLKEKEIPIDDLTGLSDDDFVKFKELFVKHKVSLAHKNSTKQMDSLYEFIADFLAKRVPVDAPGVKIDSLAGKIVLVEIPEGIYTEDYTETIMKEQAEGEPIEEKIARKKNTDEKAVLLLKVPQDEEEEEI